MANPKVGVQFTVDSTGYTAAVNRAKAQIIDFGEASKRVSHGMVTDVQATSGALRLLEGGMTGNIRAAERYLASIKGVGAALQAIYPAVGLIAVGAVVAKTVIELTTMIQKTRQAGEQFHESFQEMANSSRLSNDELEKSNINLENQIAKLTGKHENVLAAQLIEARIEADHLARSAASAAKQMSELLSKDSVSFGSISGAIRMVLGNQASTSDADTKINDDEKARREAAQAISDALAHGDKSGAKSAQDNYDKLMASQLADLEKNRSGAAMLQKQGHVYGDESSKISHYDAEISTIRSEQDTVALQKQQDADTAQLKQIEDARNMAERSKAAIQKLMATYREQAAEIKASITPSKDEDSEQYRSRELAAETSFWAAKLETAKGGSEQYREIQKELSKIYEESHQLVAAAVIESQKLAEQQQKLISEITSSSSMDLTRDSDSKDSLRTSGKDAEDRLKALNESVAIQNRNADALTEASISIGLASGNLSKYNAAVQVASLHTAQYTRELALLNDELSKADAGSPEEQQVKNQISQLNGDRTIQSANDQQSIDTQTGIGSLHTSANQTVQKSRDISSQVSQIWTSTVDGINSALERLMTGKRGNWKDAFSGIFGDASKVALQKAEGSLLGAFGLGKADGSASNPFNVKVVGGGAAQAGSSVVGSLLSKSTSGSGLGGLLTGLLPGFADGGSISPGMGSFMVGERGPEILNIGSSGGSVIPNHALTGGGDTHNWSIDARGSNDPAAVHAAIMRAAPAIIAGSMHAQREAAARRPASSRQ